MRKIVELIPLFVMTLCMALWFSPISTIYATEQPGFTQAITSAEELYNINESNVTDTGYYLDADIELNESWYVKNITVSLDLNGHKMEMTGNKTIIIIQDSTLNLYDTKETGKITGGVGSCGSSGSGGAVSVGSGSGEGADILNMYGGEITGNEASYGGGIFIPTPSEGTGEHIFNMYGGTISNNKAAKYGGGVQCQGTFHMNGGTITYNEAESGGAGISNTNTCVLNDGTISKNESPHGGGIYVGNDATFNMNGGTISKNKASTAGGGVYCSGVFKMNAGNISKGTAEYGGGVFVKSIGIFDMNGGTISDSKATQYGGGVQCQGSININDGVITRNEAQSGGAGVHITNTGTMKGGTISDNISREGAGVRISGDAVFDMNGGTISGNKAIIKKVSGVSYYATGGGVCCYGIFNMNDGTVIDNNSKKSGGGIAVLKDGKFVMSNGEVSKNSSSEYGGGIWIISSQENILYNGKINNNNAKYGGGISINNDAQLLIKNVLICENDADIGGGLNILGGTLTLENGSVLENTAYRAGGAIHAGSSKWSLMSEWDNKTNIIIKNGEIKNNYSNLCGGVFLCDADEYGVSFEMHDGNISDNLSKNSLGKNVYKYIGGENGGSITFNVYDGKIGKFDCSSVPSSMKSKLCTSTGGFDDIQTTWTKVGGAKGYNVYYKEGSSAYVFYKNVTTNTVVMNNLKDGIKYTIKIVPYYKEAGIIVEANKFKTSSVYTLKKVAGVKAGKSGSKVKISWTNINGESGYQISKSTSKTGTNIVSTYATTSGKYKTISATKGKTYYYKVRAYKTEDGKKIYGPWSNVVKFKR